MTANSPTVIPTARRAETAVHNRHWRVAGNVPGLPGHRSFLSGPLIRVEVLPQGILRLRWREMGVVGRATVLDLDRREVRVQYARGRHWLRGVRLDTLHHGVIYLWCSWPSTIDRHELVVNLAASGFEVVNDEFQYQWLPSQSSDDLA